MSDATRETIRQRECLLVTEGRKEGPTELPAPAKRRGGRRRRRGKRRSKGGGTGGGRAGSAAAALLAHIPPARSTLVKLLRGRWGAAGSEYAEHTIPCSAQYYRALAEGLLSIPDDIHEFLYDTGVRVRLGNLLTQMEPSLAATQPPGFPLGLTFDYTSGCYDYHTKRILLAEFRLALEVPPSVHTKVYSALEVECALREEIGHAVDHALDHGSGRPSQTDPHFLAAFQADIAQLIDPAEQEMLDYLLQSGGQGQTETFAAVFAIMYGGYSTEATLNNLVGQRFSHCLQVVQAIVPVPGGP